MVTCQLFTSSGRLATTLSPVVWAASYPPETTELPPGQTAVADALPFRNRTGALVARLTVLGASAPGGPAPPGAPDGPAAPSGPAGPAGPAGPCSNAGASSATQWRQPVW